MSRTHLSTPQRLGSEAHANLEQLSAHNAAGFPSPLSSQWGSSVRAGDTRMDQHLQQTWLHHTATGPLSGGGQRSPGTGGANGSPVRTAGGRGPDGEPRFDQDVPDGGYLWWYIDAMSDDGQHGITLIAFVGSVFSPYYAWARRGGRTEANNHCALNVAIYSRGRSRWAMTERGRKHCTRNAQEFVIGPSQLQWDGDCLNIDIDEVCVPLPRRVRGRIKLWPQQLCPFSTRLDAFGQHRWGPLAPASRIEVDLSTPDLKWQGHAYLDSNEGDEPIDQGFHEWDWSRARMRDGSTLVFYDMHSPEAPDRVLSLRFRPNGVVETVDTPPVQRLSKTAWRIDRRMRSEKSVRVQEQLEDTPFYQRALLQFDYAGEPLLAFHETLSVPRLVSPIVQAMLPWRMPRRA